MVAWGGRLGVATLRPLLCVWTLSALESLLVALGTNTSPGKICVVVENWLVDTDVT